MIRRTLDPAFLNEIANLPDVRPHLSGEGDIDLSFVAANPVNYLLQCDAGGFVLAQHEPGIYEVHSIFRPDSGTAPVRAMREAMDWMFTRTDCGKIISKVPKSNKRAKGFAVIGGLQTVFERDDAVLGPCEYVEIDAAHWAMNCAGLEAKGEAFHALLEAAKQEIGSSLIVHAHDPSHERAVGAARLMIERNQAIKGVAFYNRWARFAGYAEIQIISLAPLLVDVVDAIIGMGENGLEVMQCR